MSDTDVTPLPRRPIVVWWREGWPTLAVLVTAVVYPSRVTIVVLSVAAILNWLLACLAERDAVTWHQLMNYHRCGHLEMEALVMDGLTSKKDAP